MLTDLEGLVRSGTAGAPIALDTETDGLNVYTGAKLRLVSLSDGTNTVVLNPQDHGRTLTALLSKPYNWVMHNSTFDAQVVYANLGIEMHATDTQTMAHLLDSRAKEQGGVGLKLEDLAAKYLGEAKQGDELKGEMARGGWTWETIPLDNPVYLQYAAQDARLTARLYGALDAFGPSRKLMEFEAQILRACARMERRGILVDREYTEKLGAKMQTEQYDWEDKARELGIANVRSPAQVRKALGLESADEEALRPLVLAGNPLAVAVKEAKRRAKWRAAYVAKFLSESDVDGRLHASIRPLQARTGRMSISSPPLQQLPSSDSMIRACLIADEGQVIFSVDFQAVEMRVAAALSGDAKMLTAISSGDIHGATAQTVYGAGYTKEQRNKAKVIGFATLYGAGVTQLAAQAQCSPEEAREIRSGFFRAYPGLRKLSNRLSSESESRGFIITASGRRLLVEKDRGYAALNYAIQSTARDLFCQSMLQVENAGLGEHLLLPIHDELLGQAREEDVEAVAGNVSDAMQTELNGVAIETGLKIGRRSWGSLYEKGTS
jgi:DNA polymerase-1